MATIDIRLDRVRHEYVGLRDAQDALMDRIDTYEAALLGLTEAVNRNSERIDMLDSKLDAIIAHLKVPYNKPPAGFVEE